MYTKPIKLTSSRAWRTYTGGSLIDKIHGIENGKDTQFPEDWIMSTVAAFNVGREDIVEGLNFIDGEDNVSLKDFIEQNPQESLGQDHIDKWGVTTGVLVKIIDAAERLSVQVHPDKIKAKELFNSQFGKTECWHVIGGRTINGEKPSIYFGFKEGVKREDWKKCFDQQDIPGMLNMMHHLYVKPGDTFLIEGGVPHAISQGCLLVEIQEPTDYTIRVEKTTPQGLKIADKQCHCGLGFEKMFECFHYDGYSEEDSCKKWKVPSVCLEETNDYSHCEIIGYNQTSCFKLERYDIKTSCKVKKDGTFCGLYILEGTGSIICEGLELPFKGGDQFFVPASCNDFTVKADKKVSMFRCFGPKH